MSESKTYEFQVEMTCDGCCGAVQRVLGKCNGVEKVDINLADQRVRVTTSTLSAEEILQVIQKTGKQCKYLSCT
ncbi:hypothetical protein ILUMI_06651 [Ignelater luminosus]|uniref:Copper transport protein ATOX1 n=1 Tax=Ignelater luminosus TaxID=2038154 RepID=A0A8K0D8U3_IGNLU|nr:hypothetical protein ILUMI_06651 [Ignelater luminosus]